MQCNGHGNCLRASVTPYFVCSCFSGYSGETCSTGKCIKKIKENFKFLIAN